MTTGIIIAVFLFLLTANIFLRRIKNVNLKRIISKLHKIMGLIFAVAVLIHMVLTLPLMKQRPIAMYILGFVMMFSAVIEVFVYVFRKQLGAKWFTIHKIFAVILLLCLVVHIGFGIGSLNTYQKRIAEVDVHNLDIENVPDGSYIGEYDAGYVYAKVNVIIKSGEVSKVELLEHRTERGQKAEVIVNQMVEQQQIDVDAVTSATNSSKVIKQAVYNAISKEK